MTILGQLSRMIYSIIYCDPPRDYDILLQEDSFALLLEDGDYIELE